MRLCVHHKITLTIFILIITLLGGIYLFLSKALQEHTYARIRNNLYKEITLASSFLESNLNKTASLEDCDKIADVIGDKLKLRCTIIREDGLVLGDSELPVLEVKNIENHSDRAEVREAERTGIASRRRFSTTLRQDLLYVAQKVTSLHINGFLRLSLPLKEIQEVQSQITRVLLTAFGIVLLIAYPISFGSSILISRPIQYISMMAKRISTGNYSGTINVRTGDEIEALARSFNEMADQVRQRVEELHANKARFEAILLSMFDGIMVVNNKGAILFTNAKLKELFQIFEEPVGKPPIEVIRKVEVQNITDAILQQQKKVISQEIEFVSPEEKTLLVHATSVMRNGEKEGAVLVFHDISELKKLEKVRKDFVANVSHELRTPLTSIKGYAETLLEGALQDTESAHDFVGIIYKEANRVTLLVNDLLDLSRLDSGKYTLMMRPAHIEDIVGKALERMKTQADAKSITLKKLTSASFPAVTMDETAILQVLLNLLDNAIKYTHVGGDVCVSVSREHEFIQVAVKDNGTGIPESDLPRIFERFYRVDKTRSLELGGTGLGLSIAKHIVLAHSGTISVESVIDQGSTFRFTIPLAQSSQKLPL